MKKEEEAIDLNPQFVITYDENMVPRYEFGGYDVSPEDMRKLQRRYGNGEQG